MGKQAQTEITAQDHFLYTPVLLSTKLAFARYDPLKLNMTLISLAWAWVSFTSSR